MATFRLRLGVDAHHKAGMTRWGCDVQASDFVQEHLDPETNTPRR
jgi:hypothetical protein